jgi:glycosyltransferase involved in cell wall biosynthesis
MISVIIPSYRNPRYLDLCLHSLTTHQINQNEIIVVLDGYVEENKEVIEKYPTVSWLPFEENMGMQTAVNFGVWNATSEKIFIINDDNVFPPEWDVRVEEQYHSNTIITVNQIEPTGPGMFNFPVIDCGQTVDTFDMSKFIRTDKELSSNKLTKDGNIFPFLMNKRWFMAVGGFDTYYNSPNWCDVDFFMKLELIPTIEFARIHNVHLYHFGSVATRKNKESSLFIQRQQFAYQQYEYKWGCVPNIVENALYHNNSKFLYDGRKFRGFTV